MPTERRETQTEPDDQLIADVFARGCASRSILEDVVGKWGILALLALGESRYRFNALRRRVDGISEKMLAQTLQTLERDGLVVREVQGTIPPRVEYSLTPFGTTVADRLRSLVETLEEGVGEALAAQGRVRRSAFLSHVDDPSSTRDQSVVVMRSSG